MNNSTQQSLQELSQERDRLQRENAQLAAALLHIAEYWNGLQTEEAMYDACRHIREFATSQSGGAAVLRDLLAPTFELLDHLTKSQQTPTFYVQSARQELARLRPFVKEGQ